MAKISGPLLDRIDLHIEVPAVPFRELSSKTEGTSSSDMRERVTIAQAVQQQRFKNSRTRRNAQMTTREIRTVCKLDAPSMNVLQASIQQLGLSARAHDKILRVSRTLADLENRENILTDDITEAVNYRMLDRSMWS